MIYTDWTTTKKLKHELGIEPAGAVSGATTGAVATVIDVDNNIFGIPASSKKIGEAYEIPFTIDDLLAYCEQVGSQVMFHSGTTNCLPDKEGDTGAKVYYATVSGGDFDNPSATGAGFTRANALAHAILRPNATVATWIRLAGRCGFSWATPDIVYYASFIPSTISATMSGAVTLLLHHLKSEIANLSRGTQTPIKDQAGLSVDDMRIVANRLLTAVPAIRHLTGGQGHWKSGNAHFNALQNAGIEYIDQVATYESGMTKTYYDSIVFKQLTPAEIENLPERIQSSYDVVLLFTLPALLNHFNSSSLWTSSSL